jgi:Spirocyclase AveC-like
MATRSTPNTLVLPPEQSQLKTTSRLRPIHYWSALGVVFVLVQLYVYGSWLFSGEVHPQTTGADPVPAGVKAAAWIVQSICILAALTLVVYVWRRSRREGALAWDAFVAIGFALAYWQDPIINFARPVFFYNSYLINVGSWTPHIPGWLSPYSGNLPEPFLMIAPLFAVLFVVLGALFCAMARRLQRIRPNIGQVGIFFAGILVFGIFNIFMEAVFLQTQLFVYAGVVNPLSLFAGHTFQFPLYEALIAGVNASVVGMIRFTRDENGRSVIERGVDELHVGTGAKTLARVLAFVGLGNAVLVMTNIVYIGFSFHVDQMPHYPSYLNNDICGAHVSAPCPGPGVPVLINNNPHRTTTQ